MNQNKLIEFAENNKMLEEETEKYKSHRDESVLIHMMLRESEQCISRIENKMSILKDELTRQSGNIVYNLIMKVIIETIAKNHMYCFTFHINSHTAPIQNDEVVNEALEKLNEFKDAIQVKKESNNQLEVFVNLDEKMGGVNNAN